MAFVQLRGIPSLPPNSAPEKLFYLITLAGLIGVALDLLGRPPLIGRLAFVLFPAICLAWFSLRLLLAQPDVGLLIKLAIMWAQQSPSGRYALRTRVAVPLPAPFLSSRRPSAPPGSPRWPRSSA
jgi:hypothetical protein